MTQSLILCAAIIFMSAAGILCLRTIWTSPDAVERSYAYPGAAISFGALAVAVVALMRVSDLRLVPPSILAHAEYTFLALLLGVGCIYAGMRLGAYLARIAFYAGAAFLLAAFVFVQPVLSFLFGLVP